RDHRVHASARARARRPDAGDRRPTLLVDDKDFLDTRLSASAGARARGFAEVRDRTEAEDHLLRLVSLAVVSDDREAVIALGEARACCLHVRRAGLYRVPVSSIDEFGTAAAVDESEVIVQLRAPRHCLIG